MTNPKSKLYLALFMTLIYAYSTKAQMTLKESNTFNSSQKIVEILTDIPQKSIKLKKGQKLKIGNFRNQEKAKLVLSDVSGKIILQENIFAYNPLSSKIDLNSGTYFLSISVEENNPIKSILIVNNY